MSAAAAASSGVGVRLAGKASLRVHDAIALRDRCHQEAQRDLTCRSSYQARQAQRDASSDGEQASQEIAHERQLGEFRHCMLARLTTFEPKTGL